MSDSVFKTSYNGSDTYAIAGFADGYTHSGELIIPEYVAGERIVAIAAYAFMSCQNLTSVIMADNIEAIAYSAFSSCTNLTSVTIPDSVGWIDGSAFNGCSKLTTVYVDDPNNLSEAVSSYNWPSGVTFKKISKPVEMSTLTIHKLTLDQYKTAKSEGKVAEDEVYVVTDLDTAIPDVSAEVNAHNTSTSAHSDIRTALNDKVPVSRTVNGKALSGDITLSASDVSATPANSNIVQFANNALSTLGGAAVNVGGGQEELIGKTTLTSNTGNITFNVSGIDLTQYKQLRLKGECYMPYYSYTGSGGNVWLEFGTRYSTYDHNYNNQYYATKGVYVSTAGSGVSLISGGTSYAGLRLWYSTNKAANMVEFDVAISIITLENGVLAALVEGESYHEYDFSRYVAVVPLANLQTIELIPRGGDSNYFLAGNYAELYGVK